MTAGEVGFGHAIAREEGHQQIGKVPLVVAVVEITDVERWIGKREINAALIHLLHGFDAIEPVNRVQRKHQVSSVRAGNSVDR